MGTRDNGAKSIKVQSIIPRPLLDKIDKKRGDVTRSLYIRRAIEKEVSSKK